MNIPRNEHPNPQWERKNWENLNGEWQFEIDNSRSALERGKNKVGAALDNKITVPFCPESELSGINYKDFMYAVCYKRNLDITKEKLNGRIKLHFGAVDFKARVFINGNCIGEHLGGYTSFEFDITDAVNEGSNELFVYAEDDLRSDTQCAGKQCKGFYSYGCSYTRTTGIWQTVWLEYVPESALKFAKFYPNAENGTVTIIGETIGSGKVNAVASFEGKTMGKAQATSNGSFILTVALSEKHLWNVGDGKLYDLELTFGEDEVKSYFGLRDIGFDGYKFVLNGKSVFQRLVLDQGFYPDGIYTASTDSALEKDIILSMEAGFNGARLHEKVFEARFLYYCDKHGYLVWGEYPNWGINHSNEITIDRYANEWTEAMNRDFNHPSIIGWCPFNETWGYYEQNERVKILSTIYKLTKAIDPTRPCIDTSGNFHVITDVYDVHDYNQDPVSYAKTYKAFDETGDFDYGDSKEEDRPFFRKWYKYIKGMPAFISEYGGIKWNPDDDGADREKSWGYGDAPKTEEEFIARYKGLTDSMLDNRNMFGFCYTQLYDVEQEQNGLYTYGRKPKFDMKIFHDINARKAAIED